MAPEQAKGQEADRRADVWAFGCVLFEMLTGRAVFEGDTNGEILAEVLKTDPDWRQVPEGTPEAIRHLLRRCLHKDRRFRLHDMADVRIEVEEALSPPFIDLPIARSVRRGRERLVWISVAVLAAALAATATWVWREARSNAAAREMRVDVATPPTTDPMSFEISPDGRSVVFVATFEGRPRLWLRALDGKQRRGHCPEPILRLTRSGRQTIDPSASSQTCDSSVSIWTAGQCSHSPESKSASAAHGLEDGVHSVQLGACPSDLSHRRYGRQGGAGDATARAADGSPLSAHALPDGRHFLYYATGAPESSPAYMWPHLDGSEARRLFPADSAAIYASPGHLLFVRQGTLYACALRSLDA